MARLSRVRPGVDPGFRRIRARGGFRYEDARGKAPGARDVERIDALVIPPAWEDVWISAEPRGHIQAVGTDAAGRSQYLYHEDWRTKQDKGKFARALLLAQTLPQARAKVTIGLQRAELDRERVLAAAFRLLDEAAPRVGSARYMKRNGSRGLTTLQRRDAAVDGSVITLSFPAKSGKRALLTIDDELLASVVELLAAGRARSTLLSFRRGRRRVPLVPQDVNAHVRALTGGAFTAKDFRTLRGTIVAAESLSRIGEVDTGRQRAEAERLAVRATAEVLGNTPSVARSSYIDPRVFSRYARGELLDLSRSPESAIRDLLA